MRDVPRPWANWLLVDKQGVISKETVVLRRWGRETQNFGFINRVD